MYDPFILFIFSYILQGINPKHEFTWKFQFMLILFHMVLHSIICSGLLAIISRLCRFYQILILLFQTVPLFLRLEQCVLTDAPFKKKCIFALWCDHLSSSLSSFKPFVPKKAPRSVKAAQALKKESADLASIQSVKQDGSDAASLLTYSRENSEILASQALRKTEVKIETQPNGSEVTTTIMEIENQVKVTLHSSHYIWTQWNDIHVFTITSFPNSDSNIVILSCFRPYILNILSNILIR